MFEVFGIWLSLGPVPQEESCQILIRLEKHPCGGHKKMVEHKPPCFFQNLASMLQLSDDIDEACPACAPQLMDAWRETSRVWCNGVSFDRPS